MLLPAIVFNFQGKNTVKSPLRMSIFDITRDIFACQVFRHFALSFSFKLLFHIQRVDI